MTKILTARKFKSKNILTNLTRHGSLICENNKSIAKLTDNSIEINQYNE